MDDYEATPSSPAQRDVGTAADTSATAGYGESPPTVARPALTCRAGPAGGLVRGFIRASKAESTVRGYDADWRAFCAWSEKHGLSPLPSNPDAVAAYIAESAGHLKPGSIQRRLN